MDKLSWEDEIALGKRITSLISEEKFLEAKDAMKPLLESENGHDDVIDKFDETYSKEKEEFVNFYLPHSTKYDFFRMVEFLIDNKLDLQPAVERIIKFSVDDELEPYNFLMSEYIIALIDKDPRKMSLWIGDNWGYLLEIFTEVRHERAEKYLPQIIKSLANGLRET